jgi:Spy/CpxP family protein refolding chaperone
MIKKTLALLMVLVMFGAMSWVLDARQGPGDMMKRMRMGIRLAEKNLFPAKVLLRMKDRIPLTEDQVQQIEKMRMSVDEYIVRANADIKVQDMRLDSYLKGDKINRSEVEKMVRNIAKMKTDLHVAHINHLLDLRDLLSEEQIKKIEEVKTQMRHRFMERRAERRKRRPHKEL